MVCKTHAFDSKEHPPAGLARRSSRSFVVLVAEVRVKLCLEKSMVLVGKEEPSSFSKLLFLLRTSPLTIRIMFKTTMQMMGPIKANLVLSLGVSWSVIMVVKKRFSTISHADRG